MKASDFEVHAKLLQRVIERVKATENPSPQVLDTLAMLRDEYAAAPQIITVDPET